MASRSARAADIAPTIAELRAAGATPLHIAASWSRRDVLQLFLASGADPGARDKNGKTALDLAVDNQQGEIVEILRKAR